MNDGGMIPKSTELRAAALAAMEPTAPAEETVAETPVETPAETVETKTEPTGEKPRGADGKFLKREAREALAKALTAKTADEPTEDAAEAPSEQKTEEEKEPTRREVREDIIAQRQMKAANQRRQEALDAREAELRRQSEAIETDRKRYAEAKKSPVAYLKELAKETGVPFFELYEAATLEMTGQNPKPAEPQTPLEKAMFDKLAALEAKLAAKEKTEEQQKDEAAVRASQDTFVQLVKTGAEKYPLLSKESEADQREASVVFAQNFKKQHGRWPSYDEAAETLESRMRAHYEANGSAEIATLQEQVKALELKLASLKTTPVSPQGAPDRGNGAGLPAKPARPQTLSNGHAAVTPSMAKELSIQERRAAARRLLG